MTRTSLSLVAALFATIFFSTAASAKPSSAPQPTDLTARFRGAGLPIDQLLAFEIGGIVVIRGRTADSTVAEEAGRFAQKLGYARVANLIQVVPPPDDAVIARLAERELASHRSLDGCTFHIASELGVVKVGGEVRREFQKDMAIEFLRNIDGVKEVRADLRKR